MLSYLKQLIEESPAGLISYADYINAALYHPELGYYMKDKQKIGKQGDFITTSNISDIYGKMMAKWFFHICKKTQIEPVFCEIGAGTGRFAQAFFQEWAESISLPLKYLIVESSPYHRKIQRNTIQFPVIQVENLGDLDSFTGLIFSNELFDALPVHVVEKENGMLFEVMVGMENGQLVEKKVPLINAEIKTFLKKSQFRLKEKQRMEIPLAMEQMLQDLSQVLTKGIVVTADYGYTKEEWMEPARMQGSLRGYYQHRLIDDVLQYPGEMDITTHVHFDELIQKGEEAGLKLTAKLRQDEFLLKAGILKELEEHHDSNPFSEVSKRNRAIRSLIMPSGVSTYFHIIIQQKGVMLTKDDIFK